MFKLEKKYLLWVMIAVVGIWIVAGFFGGAEHQTTQREAQQVSFLKAELREAKEANAKLTEILVGLQAQQAQQEQPAEKVQAIPKPVIKVVRQAPPEPVQNVSTPKPAQPAVIVREVQTEPAQQAPTLQPDTKPEPVDVDIVGLAIEPESNAPYDRGEWGSWRTTTVNRHLKWKQHGCLWAFYTATSPHCLSGVDRDHLVALKEVHDSGGHAWSNDRKRDFYNDLNNLYVMPSGENRSKGARDFAEWQPRVGVCRYAQEYIATKKRWGLSVDEREHKALTGVLTDC